MYLQYKDKVKELFCPLSCSSKKMATTICTHLNLSSHKGLFSISLLSTEIMGNVLLKLKNWLMVASKQSLQTYRFHITFISVSLWFPHLIKLKCWLTNGTCSCTCFISLSLLEHISNLVVLFLMLTKCWKYRDEMLSVTLNLKLFKPSHIRMKTVESSKSCHG